MLLDFCNSCSGMDSGSVVDMIEASSGAHFSGFHMNGLKNMGSAEQTSTSTSTAVNMQKQPFVIGNISTRAGLCTLIRFF